MAIVHTCKSEKIGGGLRNFSRAREKLVSRYDKNDINPLHARAEAETFMIMEIVVDLVNKTI